MMKRLTTIKRLKTAWTNFELVSSLLRILIGLVPWDCLAVGISRHTPLNYSGSIALIGVCVILIQLILRERIGFATILDALLTGNIVQFLCDISPYPDNHGLWRGIVFMLFGFLFIALGMYVYMKAEMDTVQRTDC